MNKVKIYEITCYSAYMISEQGTGFSLEPWGKNTIDYKGLDDDGIDYLLPDGYSVGISKSGTKAIYDSKDNYCELIDYEGFPALVTCSEYLKLEKVEVA